MSQTPTAHSEGSRRQRGKVFRVERKSPPAQSRRPSGDCMPRGWGGGKREINLVGESLTRETFSKGNLGAFRQDDSPGSCLLSKTEAPVQESPNQQELQETVTTMPRQ